MENKKEHIVLYSASQHENPPQEKKISHNGGTSHAQIRHPVNENRNNQIPHVKQDSNQEAHTHMKPHFFKKWGSLIVLGLGLAIIIIDTTLLNVSLATIIKDLKTDIQSLQWVITAYSLTLAALTITGGRIGDLFGRKRMFMVGAAIFAVGSFIASISHSVGVLLAGESIIEGIGAALMMPATASLLVANFHGKDRAVAFGIWGGIAGASSAIGPILGGYLTKNFSWRWGFEINVFVAALLIAGSILLVKESRDTKEKPTIDLVGVVLSALGLLGIVFGIIESSTYGWWTAKEIFSIFGFDIDFFGLSIVPFSIIIGGLFLNLFIEWERRIEKKGITPLVSMKLFSNRTFVAGVMTTAVVSLGLVGMIFALPVFLQSKSVLSLDSLDTGITLLPLSLSLLVSAPLSAFLSHKIPIKYIILAGLVIDTAAMLLLRQSISATTTRLSLAPALALFGVGMGMVMAQVSNLTLSAVPVYQAGEASGVNNTMRQVGSSLGSAIIGAVLLSVLSTNLVSGVEQSQVIPTLYKSHISRAVSTQTSNVEFGSGVVFSQNTPQTIQTEIKAISRQATVDAVRTSFIYGAIFIFLGFLVALFIPNKKLETLSSQAIAGH